jgi:hypothetical protein
VNWGLILLGIAAIAFSTFCVCAGLGHRRMAVVYGRARDYGDLQEVRELAPYLEFFPPNGKRFYYWCYFLDGEVGGSCDISEQDFVAWAKTNGWALQDAHAASGIIWLLQADRAGEVIVPEDGLWYRKRVYEKPHYPEYRQQLQYDLSVYFDRSESKMYFSSAWFD